MYCVNYSICSFGIVLVMFFCGVDTFFTERIAIPETMDRTKIRQMAFNNNFIVFRSCYNLSVSR